MGKLIKKSVNLISHREINCYYEYLLNAFKQEFLLLSNRQIIERIIKDSVFSRQDIHFLKQIVANGFNRKKAYKCKPMVRHRLEHPIELINYIVLEGYTPTSPFVIWAHKKFGIRWNPMHWFILLMRDISPVDLAAIREELKTCKGERLPQTLEFYYRLGTGLERLTVHPDIGIKKVLNEEFKDEAKYRGFNPIDYLDYYYGGLDKEDMAIARTLYTMLVEHRQQLPPKSKALIVGNGPVPDEAQTLAMLPEIDEIVPADVDSRNINIMQRHTGGRNPLSTQKARPGEEHADFIYYLFEKYACVNYGLFAVREITSAKTADPAYVDVSKSNPLELPMNPPRIKNLKADLVVVPFCPESITDNIDTYRTYIRNISTLVEPKKHLCMLALKNAEFYLSGVKKLKAVPINEDTVFQELTRNGFKDIEIITIKTGLSSRKRGFSDSMIIWSTKA
ncbi:NNMT/PNMT/TEMT family protein [uncultured archaeon]|nr:NNMT/PNMT/TEMT family protein [uncultured archaeon]